MSDATLDRCLQQHFAAHPDGDVNVAFQGGEPLLMGLDFFRRVVALSEGHRRPEQVAVYSIQTNATLLDPEWAAFLSEQDFLVGVSIDGPAEVHDAYRRTAAGEPTHARVMRSIELLAASGVQWNALTTISNASNGRGREIYEFLRDEARARFIQFIPIVERPTDEAGTPFGTAVTERSISSRGYGSFLTDVFDLWVRRDVGEVYVQDFDVALAAWAHEGHPLCVHSPTCGRALAVEFNGDVYSCDHFVDPPHLLGNVEATTLDSIVESAAQLSFGQAKLDDLPVSCNDCAVMFACNGGCPKDRFLAAEGGSPPTNYLCDGFRMFYEHISEPMSGMAALLAANRAPSEMVGLIGESDRRRDAAFNAAGRNDPCPCGSGRKFKQCHGRD